MQVLLALILSVGIVIMIALIFVGYFLYQNSKRREEVSDILTEKENDLIELYEALEKMINEVEAFTLQSKNDIKSEVKNIRQWCAEIPKRESGNNIDKKEVPIHNYAPLYLEGFNSSNKASRFNSDAYYIDRKKEEYGKKVDPKQNSVMAYYDRGLPVSEIARKMGIGQGEVQLILNLRNK